MPQEPTYSSLLDCAVTAARAAGSHALENRHRRNEVVKLSAHDVKLQLDLECQKKAEEAILGCYPEHSFLGEEGAAENSDADSGYQWIVDPIDGTVNFSHGLPFWCSSVAVRKDQQALAGAVYSPILDELFSATIDGPAECNGAPIHVSDTPDLAHSIINTGTDRKFEGNPEPLRLFKAIAMAAQRARVTGFAAYDICQVAAGRADAYFEGEIYIWDVAAAGLIVERAGGRTERLREPDASWNMSFMATNGIVHDEMKQILANA